MPRYHIKHTSSYHYGEPVVTSHHRACLLPRNCPGQRVESAQVLIDPSPEQIREERDHFANRVSVFALYQAYTHFSVTSEAHVLVDRQARNVSDKSPWEQVRWQRETEEFRWASPYTPASPELRAWAQPTLRPGRPLAEILLEFNTRIHQEFTYQSGVTGVDTPLAELIERRAGVCQDFAHLYLAALRLGGIAARYVSGYLETDPPPGQMKLRGVDASHAWVQVWTPSDSWVDLDPTNGCLVGNRHISVAWGRDFGDVSPLKGVILGGGQHALQVAVDVMGENSGSQQSQQQ